MKREELVIEITLSILAGFAVALGTSLTMGHKEMLSLPGGSLVAGLIAANRYRLMGAVLGILGWFIFVLIS